MPKIKRFKGEPNPPNQGGPCDVYVVHEDGYMDELDKYLDEVNHSPSGFAWGYGGSGPAQLAFAILAEMFDTQTAHTYYQDFKKEVISSLDQDASWTLTADWINEWYENKEDMR